MNILVISGCSASKQYDGGVDEETLDTHSRSELIEREQDSNRVLPAREMYLGDGHTHLKNAIDKLESVEGVDVDWKIISAGYGTLDSVTPIVPYDCTLSGTEHNKADYRARADRLGVTDRGQTTDDLIRDIGRAKGIPQAITPTLSQYDAVFAMLGREYLLATADLFEDAPTSSATFVFAPDSVDGLTGSFTRIPANEAERKAIGAMRINQKEIQFETLVSHIDNAADLKDLIDDPDRIHSLSLDR